MKYLRPFLIAIILVHIPALFAGATIYIDIDSPSGRKIPIAIQEFRAVETSAEDMKNFERAKKELFSTLTGDIEFSGLFDVIEKESYLEDPSSGLFMEETDFRLWRAVGAELLVKGGVIITGNKLTAEFRLFDAVKGIELIAKRYVGGLENPRPLSHRFSDDLMEKLTGKKGIFSTKLSFTAGANGKKEIFVSDYDGKNATAITANGSINLSPQWSPDGKLVMYTSYKNKRPCLYALDIRSGMVSAISEKPGINIGGRWSPDGRRISLTLKGKKSPELFIFEQEGRNYVQLTDNHAIDVSPSWSPDGKKIAFTSDMAGKPQIYMIDSSGGKPWRLTHKGKYDSEPSWSPDGKLIAFSRQNDSMSGIWLTREDGSHERQLTFDPNDTSPSWSPDGRYIVFSRKKGGKTSLYTIQRDGSALKMMELGMENASGPSWSPYLD